ncbi:TPA: hypothetical protein N3J09_000878 [Salmonella enterica subsp. enterica serovar Panama]|nr:hypothetical protein [Salmonella enterica]HCM4642387.1 hypothetical protein [Salmonella enterica subsp. enterica serovar Panama]
MNRSLLLLLVAALVGCGEPTDKPEDNQQHKFTVSTDNETVNKLLPSIRAALLGLDKYSVQFKNVSVEQNYWLTIKFQIPENANIPKDYMAFGHSCFIEINREGTAVKIPKTPCKSVMLDKNADSIDSEQWFDIPAIKSASQR